MATLRQDPLSFPWEMFMQAQQMKNQNQQQMFKDIQGMGQGLGQIGTDVEAYQQKKKFQAAINALMQQQAPVTAGVNGATTPQTQADPMLSKIAPFLTPDNVGQILPSYIKEHGKSSGITPFQQSTLDLRKSGQAEHIKEFQQTMKFKEFLSDLMNSKNTKEMKFKIQKYRGDNLIKSLFDFGPTEESVGVSGDMSSMSTEELKAIAEGE